MDRYRGTTYNMNRENQIFRLEYCATENVLISYIDSKKYTATSYFIQFELMFLSTNGILTRDSDY